MDYDEILGELGQFSQWHMVMILPLFATMGTAAFGILSFSFTGKKDINIKHCFAIYIMHSDNGNSTIFPNFKDYRQTNFAV